MAQDGDSRQLITTVDRPRAAAVSPVTPVPLPAGRFVEEGELGSGGTATVYAAFDKTLMRRSAMKVLAPKLQRSTKHRQRFIEEAQITGQLDHPNVVPVHELSVNEQGSPYFVMKLIEGYTVEDMLKARRGEARRLDWVVAFLEILVKVCDAVSFAHSRGVIHRDLKPSNIMVGSFGQVYVTDWGLARLLGDRTEGPDAAGRQRESLDLDGVMLGTPAYASPEQAWGRHEATDERSDVYCLGATLYEILTGHPPHIAVTSHAELLTAHHQIVPAERYGTTQHLPRSLCRIAMKALAPAPEHRYQTPAALKDDLVALLRGGAVFPRRTFAAGEVVMREGEVGEDAYIIVAGTCRAFKTVDGADVELRTLGPGEVFGEVAILSSKPRSASVQALEPLTVQVVTEEELRDAAGMNSALGLFVSTLAERFREVEDRLMALEASLAQPPY
jgi:eukaryotic-like serine/threonine-protein kinase